MMKTITAMPTPTPIPAAAPVESPLLPESFSLELVADALIVVVAEEIREVTVATAAVATFAGALIIFAPFTSGVLMYCHCTV